MSEMKAICGHELFKHDVYRDLNEATDLYIGETCIACRVRKYPDARFLSQRLREFTVRLTSNGRTRNSELAKIMNGYANFMLYAMADKTDSRIYAWTLISLDHFRQQVNVKNNNNHEDIVVSVGLHEVEHKKNWTNKGNRFVIFPIDTFDDGLVVANCVNGNKIIKCPEQLRLKF